MSSDVKCPKVPHPWGEVGQGWDSFVWSWAFSLCHCFMHERCVFIIPDSNNVEYFQKHRFPSDESRNLLS